jgi:hypothetical protein
MVPGMTVDKARPVPRRQSPIMQKHYANFMQKHYAKLMQKHYVKVYARRLSKFMQHDYAKVTG